MGVGDPLEATFTLSGPIAAGTWHLVGDGLVLLPVDMRFDVIRRSAGSDEVIVSFSHHFDPPEGFDAVPYEADAVGAAVASAAGDELVLRMTAEQSNGTGPAFLPNADGSHTNGRIPSLTLP